MEMGLPIWTGGPFSWIKNFDIKEFINTNKEFAKSQGARFIIDKKLIETI